MKLKFADQTPARYNIFSTANFQFLRFSFDSVILGNFFSNLDQSFLLFSSWIPILDYVFAIIDTWKNERDAHDICTICTRQDKLSFTISLLRKYERTNDCFLESKSWTELIHGVSRGHAKLARTFRERKFARSVKRKERKESRDETPVKLQRGNVLSRFLPHFARWLEMLHSRKPWRFIRFVCEKGTAYVDDWI